MCVKKIEHIQCSVSGSVSVLVLISSNAIIQDDLLPCLWIALRMGPVLVVYFK